MLSTPDLIVAAQQQVTVRSGSQLQAGAGAAPGRALEIGADGDGDGALLRLAAQPTARTVRVNVDRDRGDLVIEAGAQLAANGSIELDATRNNTLGGELRLAAGGELAVAAGSVSLGAAPVGTPGLLLDAARLADLAGAGALALRSYSTLDVYGAVNLGGPGLASLTLETGSLRGFLGAGELAQLQARRLTLGNPSAGSGDAAVASTGTLRLLADQLILADGGRAGDGTVAGTQVSGVQRLELVANERLEFSGRGRLDVAGDLAISAGVMTAAGAADHGVTATGALTTAALAAPTDAPNGGVGARLGLTGASVQHAGRLRLPSGQITLAATSGDVSLQAGSVLDTASMWQAFGSGGRASPAGSIALRADAGDVTVLAGAQIDLRGREGADAGRLELSAPTGTVTLTGELFASAAADGAGRRGQGGEVSLDVASLSDFSALNQALENGGFSDERQLRVRTGDVLIGAGDTVTTQSFGLAVDGGGLTVAGHIDARGSKGGRVALYAHDSLVLADGAVIDAFATDAAGAGSAGRGGQVELGSDSGLDLLAGSVIDVSAGAGANAAQGGQVLLRAPRVGTTDVAIGSLDSAIYGAREVVVEAVRRYEGISTLNTTGGAGALTLATVSSDNAIFMASAASIASRLGQTGNPLFHLRPGVEVRSSGNLTLASDWQLLPLRAGSEPGVLTLRVAGNVQLNGSLSDGFSTATTAGVLQAGESWSYRLVGGADLDAADPLALRPSGDDIGDITLAANKMVRTGTGAIALAAARNLKLNADTSVIYTAGQVGPAVDDFTAPNVSSVLAQFPTAGGDLRIAVGRDIDAAPARQLPTAWLFRQGRVNADGSAIAANNRTAWWLRYGDFRQGVGALGGGDVDIRAGGDVRNLGVSLPTNARLPSAAGSVPDAAQLVLQGGGDLDLRAGGDIGSALLFLGAGSGRVRAGGDIASARTSGGQAINALALLGDARLALTAGGEVALDAVANPTVLTQVSANTSGVSSTRRNYFFTYGEQAGVDAQALTGDVRFTQNLQAVLQGYPQHGIASSDQAALGMLPPNLAVAAFGGSIDLLGNAVLYPAPAGLLILQAAADLSLLGTLAMSDQLPASLPSVAVPANVFGSVSRLSEASSGVLAHGNPPLHAGDAEPARLAAGGALRGEPGAVSLVLPKAALLEAGET